MAMSLRVVGTLAWRNLWRNRRRTLVMLAAVTLGVWSMVFMSALMRGMVDEMVRGGLQTLPGEVQVHHPRYRDDPSVVNSMAMPEGALLAALEDPPVAAWTARVRVPAVVSSERESRGVVLLGVEPAGEIALGFDPADIVAGRFLENEHDRGVVLGVSLAERLETELGRRVVLMSQDPENNVADRGARVVGLYEARLQGTEEVYVYAGRAALQEMLGIGRQVSEVAASAGNYRRVDNWYPRIAAAAGSELEVLPWRQLDTFLGAMLAVQDGFALVFMLVVFLALSFGLVNTLVMAVYERVREIGLMQALGMRPDLILWQVLLESFYLLCIGLLLGNLLAFATIRPLEAGVDISAVAAGMEMMGAGTILYPVLAPFDMWMSTLVVLLLGLAASLLPAWRASRLDPIRALAKN
jgi:ABC-type lipoprotein release transport system permease subunit